MVQASRLARDPTSKVAVAGVSGRRRGPERQHPPGRSNPGATPLSGPERTIDPAWIDLAVAGRSDTLWISASPGEPRMLLEPQPRAGYEQTRPAQRAPTLWVPEAAWLSDWDPYVRREPPSEPLRPRRLTADWQGLVELERRLLQPWIDRAATFAVDMAYDDAGQLAVRQPLSWNSVLAPIEGQLLEGLRRGTEGRIGGLRGLSLAFTLIALTRVVADPTRASVAVRQERLPVQCRHERVRWPRPRAYLPTIQFPKEGPTCQRSRTRLSSAGS